MAETVEQIAEGLGSCERDLLTGNYGSWGAWITATYPGLVGLGLMQRRMDGNTMVIENTALGNDVADYLQKKAQKR